MIHPWQELLGQKHIRSALDQMAEKEHFPTPLLLVGPKGVGKKSYAQAIASFLTKHAVDTHHYYPEGKMALHTMQNLKQMQEEVQSKPFASQRKVCIIHEADRMLPSGANALLKTLEEPLQTTQIILLASQTEAMLETILSRCIRLVFKPIALEEIKQFLLSQEVNESDATLAAGIAQGSLTRALNWKKVIEQKDFALQLIQAFIKRDFLFTEKLLQQFQKRIDQMADESPYAAKEQVKEVFELIGYWFRDQYLKKENSASQVLIFSEEATSFENHDELPSLPWVHNKLCDAVESLEANLPASQALEALCCQLFYLARSESK